ncbi:hypothetical protein NQ317_004772 [Molorchus minor]|uniref:Beta-sarcoglycan n=1 Tax=Molorchus minor TaxID=1323400 RepID=A0ABQ9JIY6_9CUCU|nr:hypothetical protein NQ317_004772 [Molorchus minor]
MLDSPPTSDLFSDEADSLSVRDKTNRSISRQNINNFKAGYLPVDNTKRTSKGRKTFAFWTLIVLLLILAIGNLVLTMTILAVLRLGQGMESIELVPNAEAIKFFGNVDLDHIYKRDGILEGYEERPVVITSEDNAVILNLFSRPGRPATKLKVDKNETVFKGINKFSIRTENEEIILNISHPVFTSLQNGRNFKVTSMQTNKIRSSNNNSLKIAAERINMKGAEGAKIEGSEIVWNAEEGIYLSSNGSILLNGQRGTFLDIKRIPLVKLSNNNYVVSQFKLCVCIPGGKLFKIPILKPNVGIHCHNVNMQYNFCI